MTSDRYGGASGSSSALRGAYRLAATFLTGCQGGRCVWAHDFAPAIDTASRDVKRRIMVSVPNEATLTTFERSLGAAVSLIAHATRAARLRCVRSVNFNKRNPGSFGLIGQEETELGERPRMHHGPLGLAKPYPVADAAQLFDGDTAPGAFSLDHNAFRNRVINVGSEASLFSTPLLQQSPGRTGLPGLQPFPQTYLSVAIGIQPSTRRSPAITRGGYVDNSEVNANESVGGLIRWQFADFDGRMKKPLTVAVDEVGFSDYVATQQHQVRLGSNNRDVLQSPVNRPDRDDRLAPNFDGKLPGQAAGIERLSCVWSKNDRRFVDSETAIGARGTVVASYGVSAQRGVRVRHLANYSDRCLRSQAEPNPHFGVEAMLGINFAEHPGSMHLRRQPGRRGITGSQGVLKRHRLHLRGQHPYFDYLLHRSDISGPHRHPNSICSTARPV